MAKKKQRRFGNPARQAVADAAARERALAVQMAAVAAKQERKKCSGNDSCCT